MLGIGYRCSIFISTWPLATLTYSKKIYGFFLIMLYSPRLLLSLSTWSFFCCQSPPSWLKVMGGGGGGGGWPVRLFCHLEAKLEICKNMAHFNVRLLG